MTKKKGSKSKENIDRPDLYCSFCGKSQHDVEKLIVGPAEPICDECLVLCLNIILVENLKSKVKKDRIIKKLNLFTGLYLDRHGPVINELIEKGHCGSMEIMIYDFLKHAVDMHNRLADIMDREPINAELLKFPSSK